MWWFEVLFLGVSFAGDGVHEAEYQLQTGSPEQAVAILAPLLQEQLVSW